MKKTLLLLAVGLAFLSSCDREAKEQPKSFPIGIWQTNHEYFSITVGEANPELLKDMREKEVSEAVTEADSYRLTFNEDGTGFGSGVYPDGSGRYDFGFAWILSDSKLLITGSQNNPPWYFMALNFESFNPNDDEIVLNESMGSYKAVSWTIEESTVDKMVLSTFWTIEYNITEGILDLEETYTYRYTFEKQ